MFLGRNRRPRDTSSCPKSELSRFGTMLPRLPLPPIGLTSHAAVTGSILDATTPPPAGPKCVKSPQLKPGLCDMAHLQAAPRPAANPLSRVFTGRCSCSLLWLPTCSFSSWEGRVYGETHSLHRTPHMANA